MSLPLTEYPPGIQKPLDHRDEDHGGEAPGYERRVGRKEQKQYPGHDGLEPLGERAAEVETPLRLALGLHLLEDSGEREEEAAVEVVGEEERGEGEPGFGVLDGEGEEKAAVHDKVRRDVEERSVLRAPTAQPGHLAVESVEEAVGEPEDETQEVEAECDDNEAHNSDSEPRAGNVLAGEAAREGPCGRPVERLCAPAQLLVKHPAIIAVGALWQDRIRGMRVKPRSMVNLDSRSVRWVRFALAVATLVAFALAYLLSAGFRSEVEQAAGILGRGDVAGLRDYILSYGAWAPVVSTLLMVLQALAAPLPAFLLSFANGLAFGTFWGGMLSLAGATLAAAISFWLARALGRMPVEALIGNTSLESADRWFLRWGAYAVLVARLVPVVSFDVISFAAGLTRMRFWSFIVTTAIGMTPATFVYSYLGGHAPQYVNVLLIVFGIVIAGAVVAAVIRRRRRGKPVPLTEEEPRPKRVR